jgi:hypothetical protein
MEPVTLSQVEQMLLTSLLEQIERETRLRLESFLLALAADRDIPLTRLRFDVGQRQVLMLPDDDAP